MWIYPGIKSEFIRTESFFKNLIYTIKTPPNKKLRNTFDSMIQPGTKYRVFRGNNKFSLYENEFLNHNVKSYF
jgi:hypothetical protein